MQRINACVVKGSLRISDCTTNLTATRHVVVHVHPTANPHTTSTHDSTRLLHWSSCPHSLMVASTPNLYPEPWASLSALSESTILARDTPVALDSPSMRERPLVEYPAAPHMHTAHARVSLLWLISSIGASLAWHHTCILRAQWIISFQGPMAYTGSHLYIWGPKFRWWLANCWVLDRCWPWSMNQYSVTMFEWTSAEKLVFFFLLFNIWSILLIGFTTASNGI